ncbi:MAG: sigma-54-dependent Fis family transcriptional regulator [Nitrospirae bacterium]|nr:sigma-54-dependent Fis family transcriptional regulator [Nitrospirota bacterium]
MAKGETILVIDDEKPQRDILKIILEQEGYKVETASHSQEGLRIYKNGEADLVLTDLKLPDTTELSGVDALFRMNPNASVIIMTAHGTIDSAVEAMKKGAFDYLTKPLDKTELLISIQRAFERIRLLRENKNLRQQLGEKFTLQNIIGTHPAMQEIFKIVQKIAASSSTILIYGESGTGKELIARAIHFNSTRKNGPFRAINCAAIPESLIENELFGHEKGSFTGAVGKEIGLFEAAGKGTLFLDEIGDLGHPIQAKLLRALQEKEIKRIGGKEDVKIDVRVIAATNKNLPQEIKKGAFREDLFYRLNIISIHLPPLRERGSDIPKLVEHFLKKFNKQTGKNIKSLSKEAFQTLLNYSWPGNVRQLEGVMERTILLCDSEVIGLEDLPLEIRRAGHPLSEIDFDLPPEGFSMEAFEKQLLIKAMEKSDWVIAKAAKMLGLSYKTLQYRLDKFDLKKNGREE